MERARSDLLRAVGIDQQAAKSAGEGVYAVAEVNIRYLRPGATRRRFAGCIDGDEGPGGRRHHSSTSHAGTETLADACVTAAFLDP
jgi:acyl-CoA thioester hydrolase